MAGGRVLVLGSSGQVGRELVARLQAHPSGLVVVAGARSADDPELAFRLEDPVSIERIVRRAGPDHTFLVAAETNVARCEAEPEATAAMNVGGPAAVAATCRSVGSSLTFVSTDYVFDGTTAPSRESDPVNPLNEYGRQKLAAERAVLGDPANLVVRSCQIFGADNRRANFVLRTVDRLRDGETVSVAGDIYGTPTYAPDLARVLVELTLARARGIWHAAGESYVSRYELAVAGASAFGIADPAIRAVSADSLDDGVPRPRRSGLRNDRLHAEGHASMTPLADALAAVAALDERR